MTEISINLQTTEETPADIKGAYLLALTSAVGSVLSAHDKVKATFSGDLDKGPVNATLEIEAESGTSSATRDMVGFVLLSKLGTQLAQMEHQGNLDYLDISIR